MKTVLLITGRIFHSSAQGVRYENLIRLLKDRHNFIHLTFDKSLLSLEDVENYEINSNFFKNFRRIFIRFLFKYLKIIFPDEYRYFIFDYLKAIKTISLKYEIDTIIIGLTPFSFMELAQKIKIYYKNFKIIGDLSDPFSFNAQIINKNQKNKNKRQSYELKYLPFFDIIIVLNKKIQKYYSELLSGYGTIISVVEQGVNEGFINVNKTKETKKIFKNFIYAGGFYKGFREPFQLYRAVESIDTIVLHVYGAIKKQYRGDNIHNIIYHGYISQKELITRFSDSDVIVLIDNAYGIQVPGKIIECITIGKPILFIYENEESPSLDYIKKAGNVFLCKNSANHIIRTLELLLNSGSNIVDTFDPTPFLWESLAKDYSSLINN